MVYIYEAPSLTEEIIDEPELILDQRIFLKNDKTVTQALVK